MSALLSVNGLTQRFGGIVALDDVSLAASADRIHGLIGPNGAGKTTLFDCITGMSRPIAGEIVLGDVNITNESSVKRARRGLRRTFQRQQVFGWLTVEDNVLLALEWRGGGGGLIADLLAAPSRRRREAERRERAGLAIERCGLTGVRNEAAGHLSIGELRRLELARAIVDEPSVLLLDETTSGLEDAEIDRIGRILTELRDGGTCAIVLVEHHLPFVLDCCDEITVLDLGKVIAHGAPDEMIRSDVVRDAYLS